MMYSMKLKSTATVWILGITFLGLIFMIATNPQNLPPLLLITPFLILFLIIFMLIVSVIRVLKIGKQGLSRGQLLTIGLYAGYPVMLLVLQSVGQLSVRDVVTLTFLLVVAVFYVSKLSFET